MKERASDQKRMIGSPFSFVRRPADTSEKNSGWSFTPAVQLQRSDRSDHPGERAGDQYGGDRSVSPLGGTLSADRGIPL